MPFFEIFLSDHWDLRHLFSSRCWYQAQPNIMRQEKRVEVSSCAHVCLLSLYLPRCCPWCSGADWLVDLREALPSSPVHHAGSMLSFSKIEAKMCLSPLTWASRCRVYPPCPYKGCHILLLNSFKKKKTKQIITKAAYLSNNALEKFSSALFLWPFFLSSQVHRVELTLLSDFWGWSAWSSMVWEMFSFAFFLFSLSSVPTAVARVLKWEYLEICTLLIELRVSCMRSVTMLAPKEKPTAF